MADEIQPHRGPRHAAEQDLELLNEVVLPRGDIGQDHRRRLLAFETAHRIEEDLALRVDLVTEEIVLAGESGQGGMALS